MQLKFDYTFKANEPPFNIQAIYHDDKFTYIKTKAPEKFCGVRDAGRQAEPGHISALERNLRDSESDGFRIRRTGQEAHGVFPEGMRRHAMPEPMINSPSAAPIDPELRRNEIAPKGVIQKNLKAILYLGAALLVIVAAVFSGTGKKTPAESGNRQQAPQPVLQDNTANNVADLKSQVAAAEERAAQQQPASSPSLASTAAQQAAAAAYGPTGQPVCPPGQPCASPQAAYQQQISPAQQEEQQLAAKDRELAYESRFASNLVFTQTSVHPPSSDPARSNEQPTSDTGAASSQDSSSLISPRAAGDPTANEPAKTPSQQSSEVNIDSAVGQPYVVYEGLTEMDTILMNRLDGDAPGPVKVLVSSPVYSHDRQHVLIPDGTIVLGEARKIGASGFGQQRRIAVVFHRMIMPDGYSEPINFAASIRSARGRAKGQGQQPLLRDLRNLDCLGCNRRSQPDRRRGGGTLSTSGSQAFTTGAASSVSQSATTVLDRFIQIPPTINIREGHRVKVYFVQDMLLPAYDNHTIPQTF